MDGASVDGSGGPVMASAAAVTVLADSSSVEQSRAALGGRVRDPSHMIYLAVRLVGGAAMFVWNEQSAISSQQLALASQVSCKSAKSVRAEC